MVRCRGFSREDHPRTRGEKSSYTLYSPVYLGSPPHTRGKEPSRAATPAEGRITPAHAGKRQRFRQYISRAQDHPRTRGEKRGCYCGKCGIAGSPPHTRGKGSVPAFIEKGAGITPAHAGKRYFIKVGQEIRRDHPRTRGEKFSTGKKNFAGWDHPRTRGEKVSTGALSLWRGASPPHTRGKGISRLRLSAWRRITPAHAGKSNRYGEQN